MQSKKRARGKQKIPSPSKPEGWHEWLWKVVHKLPTDFQPYGKRDRCKDPGNDCSCGCRFYLELKGELGQDWGVCVNPRSPRRGLLTFEHMGCKKFAYDKNYGAEEESADEFQNKRKRQIQFPVVGKGEALYPKKGHKCPMCNKDMFNGKRVEQVILTIGALRRQGRNSWAMLIGKDFGGFMSVNTHTHGEDTFPDASVDVVDLAANGQADLAFCSPVCLLEFFKQIVGELYKQMDKGIDEA